MVVKTGNAPNNPKLNWTKENNIIIVILLDRTTEQ